MINIFSGRSIRRKILIAFAALIVLYVIAAATSYYYMNQVNYLARDVVPHVERINSLHEFAIYVESLERNIDKFFTVGYEEYHENAHEDLEIILGLIAELKNNSGDYLASDIEEMERIMTEIKKDEDSIAQLGNSEIDSMDVNRKIILIYNQIATVKEIYNRLLSENIKTLNLNAAKQNDIIIMVLQYIILIGVSTFIIGISVSLFLSKSISGSIVKLRDAANKIGKGNLDMKIDIRSRDEIGELASAFIQMSKDLKQSQTEIKKHAAELEQNVLERTKDLDQKIDELTKTKTAVLNMMEDTEVTNKQLIGTQEELQKSLQKLEEMDIKKDQFISIAAHELKTPLTSIHGFSQLLQNRKIANNFTKRNKYLKIMSHETKRLAKLVSDILDLSRIDLGTIRLSFGEVDINKMMENIKREMDIPIKFKGLKSEYDIEKNLPKITTDKEKLTEILLNIINNAVKYTPKGSIDVKTFRDGGNVHFIVKDTGIGIAKGYQEKIFERFYQVDSSYSRKAGGTGLGLALCKEFVDFLGGKIWVESEVGKGSKFHFTLPVKGIPKRQMKVEEREAKEVLKKSEERRENIKNWIIK